MPWEIDFIVWLQSLGQQGSIVYYINRFFTFFGEDLFIAGIFCLFYWSIDKKAAVRLGLAACASETILRTIFGAAVLVAVQFGLKAIFSLIATEGFAANWLKLLRYTILFVIVAGIYPMSFGFISRISGRKKLGNKA